MNKSKMILGGIVALVVLVLGGTWVYINVIKEDAPDELSLDDVGTSTTTDAPTVSGKEPATGATGSDSLDGEWTVVEDGTEVGYRVKEVLFGQDTEGVGRTSKVTGSLTIDGTTVPKAEFEVDMASIKSDEDRRDGQFNGRIMETSEFPTSTFTLTEPIDLGTIPADGEEISATATGDLTLKGTTKSVELDLKAKRSGDTFNVLGNYEIVFEDWGIDNPSNGPVTTEDNGLLEMLLVFEKA